MAKRLGGFDSLFDNKENQETIKQDTKSNIHNTYDEESIVRTFRIKKSTAHKLKVSAAKNNLKMGDLLDRAIQLFFDQNPDLQ